MFTDAEGAVRVWARSHPYLSPLVGSRVFFGIPTSTAYPLVQISRVGGGPNEGLAPLDEPRLSFAIRAETKKEAADVMIALVTALQEMENERLDSFSIGEGASGITVLWLPDPTDDQPRYIVDATVTVLAHAAA